MPPSDMFVGLCSRHLVFQWFTKNHSEMSVKYNNLDINELCPSYDAYYIAPLHHIIPYYIHNFTIKIWLNHHNVPIIFPWYHCFCCWKQPFPPVTNYLNIFQSTIPSISSYIHNVTMKNQFGQWPFQEPIDWRYLPYIRPFFKAYFLGLCKGISLENIAKYMVLTYLHVRILEFRLNI